MSTASVAGFAELGKYRADDTLPFYEAEGQVLKLWDQLQELKLEKALYETCGDTRPEEQLPTLEVTDEQVKDAEAGCVDARAAYALQLGVVESVLVADPILKAVHSGNKANHTERHLHPLINRRDELGIALTNLQSNLQCVFQETTEIEREYMSSMVKNKELAAEMLDLAKDVQNKRADITEAPNLVAQIDCAQQQATTAKARWRIMKSVVGAMIAGSGVDWARDAKLRDLVLDNENELN